MLNGNQAAMKETHFDSSHLDGLRLEEFRAHRKAAMHSCGVETSWLTDFARTAPPAGVVFIPSWSYSAKKMLFAIVPDDQQAIVRLRRYYFIKLGYNTIGRRLDNQIVIPSAFPDVSRRHCVLVVHHTGEAEIFDLGSLNGTYLNSKQINSAQPLRSDDILTLGDISLKVRLYRTE